MAQHFEVSPGLPPPDQRVTLGELVVSQAVHGKLARVSAATGATAAWHRRAALTEYLNQFNDDGTRS